MSGRALARSNGKPPALVLGGTENAVSVARALHRAGVPVHAIGDRISPVRFSRACATYAELDPTDAQGSMLRWLEQGGARPGVVLPCDDDGVELVARHRARLEALGYVAPESDDEVALAMLDKARTYELARAIGVDAPLTFTVHDAESLARARGGIAYPCAIKPVSTHVFKARSGSSAKGFVVAGREELDEHFGWMLPLGVPMLVTEIIEGDEDQFHGYYSFLDESGEPLLHVTKRKLRQHPPGFGRGTYHVTTRDPDVQELGLRFLQGAGVRGLANVEFKRDRRTGALRLIECNYRFTAINELIRLAGMDLALFSYNRLTGGAAVDVSRYRAGVRLWHPVADARSGLRLVRKGDTTPAAWVRSVLYRQHLPIFRWNDPKASTGYALARARRRRVRRRAGRGDGAGPPTLGPGPPRADVNGGQSRPAATTAPGGPVTAG
jgi:predicted ATP-grasp superfamily ATP-dependent carboligase